MKKVKFMLTAVAVLAVVGGALAFKALSLQNVYCDAGTVCQKVAWKTNIADTDTTEEPCGSGITTFFTTNVGNQNCQDLNSTTTGTVYSQPSEN